MDEQLYIADRATIDSASDLLANFGQSASLEAATRAGHSRELGNVRHFCRWRQVERLIDLLSSENPVGTVH